MNIEYQYSYRMGIKSNRAIEFAQDPNQNNEFSVKAYAIINRKKNFINHILAEQIDLEILTSSEKVQLFIDRRNEVIKPIPKNIPFNKLSVKQQKKLLKALEPDGPARIQIINSIGTSKRFEKIERLIFFNPS